jgi:hypothetical protein
MESRTSKVARGRSGAHLRLASSTTLIAQRASIITRQLSQLGDLPSITGPANSVPVGEQVAVVIPIVVRGSNCQRIEIALSSRPTRDARLRAVSRPNKYFQTEDKSRIEEQKTGSWLELYVQESAAAQGRLKQQRQVKRKS